MLVKYDRVERTGTPSILEIRFQPGAVSNGQVKLHVSQNVVEVLGAQRVIPAPLDTAIDSSGLKYTFSAGHPPGSVEFALQPSKPGIYHFSVEVPGSPAISARVIVMP